MGRKKHSDKSKKSPAHERRDKRLMPILGVGRFWYKENGVASIQKNFKL